ncbi:MAG: ribosome biogenesis GTPase YlqF [Polaromonas sp.]|nr:ribosome biogenesis GTPase YlqF [Polaromonas sp.]
MSIQWFPGHMHLTRQAIEARVKDIDVFIELLDARLPGSSANPMLAELTAGRPTVKVLNKQDLADPERTATWLAHYNAQPGTLAFALSANPGIGEKKPIQRLRECCFELAPLRGGMVKPMRVLIGGVPNVGKSTLINSLVGRKTAKTGDEAGVTRHEQRFVLADDFYLYDTPGMLWPRISVPQSGYHLAVSGAVGKNAYDEPEVALEFLNHVAKPYAALLKARYKLTQPVDEVATLSDEQLLEVIAGKVQAVGKGGHVDWQKAAERVITDFRTGALGRITLELPDELAEWRAQAALADEAREAKKMSRKPPKKKTGQRQRVRAAQLREAFHAANPNPAADPEPTGEA